MIFPRFNVIAAVMCVTICSYGEPTVAVKLQQHASMNLENPKTELLPSLNPVKRSASDPVTMEYIDSVCGQENVISDIKQQNVKAISRFPWTAAILKRDNNKLQHRCGGSLISTRTVISAGHCFINKMELDTNEFIVSINWYNHSDGSDALNIEVEKVILHPAYLPNIFIGSDADLAVLQLKQSVTFTDSIKPICMWQGSEDVGKIVGASGTIVSWGGNEDVNTKVLPKVVNAEIVSDITCIRSNSAFINLTSNRTLCAGNRDGTGPCLGDAGNGLMIKMNNKWMLRGVLSTALIPDSSSSESKCSLDDYVIYSDTAKYTEWIRSNMLL